MAAAQSKPGGRRVGQGRPSAFKGNQELLQQAAMEYLQDPKRFKVMMETAYDLGTGGGGWIMGKLKQVGSESRLILEERECRLSDGSSIRIYRRLPDTGLLRALIEWVSGKAPTRGVVAQDTEIRVVTGVPRGKPQRVTEEEEEDGEE